MFEVDIKAKRVLPLKGNPPVLNPFDENALEAALKIKDSHNSTSITVLSMGRSLPKPIVRKSLATGADELVVLEDDTFDDLDSFSSANILTAAVKKMGGYDLILCGREAADTDAGQVGSGMAELLGIPSVTLASKIEVADKKLRVERVLSDGYEAIEVPLPALVTVTSEMGSLRSAVLAGIIAAQKKPLKVWNAQELGVNPSRFRKITLFKLFQPVRESKCEIINAADPEEAAGKLALRLKEIKII
jgi:electron transfer flavoprotein beta subunit